LKVLVSYSASLTKQLIKLATKIILDCDPGHDDAVAILLALAAPEQVSLSGLTVVGGNVPLQRTVDNALRVLMLAGREDVPVFAGCPRPLVREMVTAEHVHGESGLDTASGELLAAPRAEAQKQHAVNHIIDTVRESAAGTVTLVATGPLTNIATALVMAPDIIDRLQQLVIMGGAFHEPGNATPAAEFNIYVDPHAARSVFESGVPIVVFGLDVTHQMLITPSRLSSIQQRGGRTGQVVADFLEFFNQYDMSKYGWDGAPLHDPCTIAWLIDPTIFDGREMAVTIDTYDGPNLGRTVADWYKVTDDKPNATVITTGDSDRFFALIVERLATLH